MSTQLWLYVFNIYIYMFIYIYIYICIIYTDIYLSQSPTLWQRLLVILTTDFSSQKVTKWLATTLTLCSYPEHCGMHTATFFRPENGFQAIDARLPLVPRASLPPPRAHVTAAKQRGRTTREPDTKHPCTNSAKPTRPLGRPLLWHDAFGA